MDNSRKKYVETVLEKRFGKKAPEEIACLVEINTFTPADGEDNSMGIGVQLLVNDFEKGTIKEEYQVNKNGIIFSWGNTPVIDERSLRENLD